MKRYLRQILDLLLFSNLFMALCAVAQALVTYSLLIAKADPYVLGILFCSTLGIYNLSILLAKPKRPERSPFRRIRWFYRHHRLIISITIIAVLSLIPLVLFLSTASQFLLLFLGAISILYNLPIFTVGDRKFGLRNIPGIKLFLIATVWSLSSVLLPILELERNQITAVTSSDTLLLIAKRFIFIAALAIPFDIRDFFGDKHHEVKTIPVMLGTSNALLFCQGMLIIYMLLLFRFTNTFDGNFIGLALTAMLLGWLILKSKQRKTEYYYFFYLDGILIAQYLLVLLFNAIKL